MRNRWKPKHRTSIMALRYAFIVVVLLQLWPTNMIAMATGAPGWLGGFALGFGMAMILFTDISTGEE